MSTGNKLGIWMDHSNAHLMEFTASPIESKTISSTFTQEVKEESLGRSEHIMHNKEQHKQAEYYKQLSDKIIHFDEVLLFGPTDAKAELFNILKDNHLFSNIKIDIKQADKMTENQQHAFVRDHFSRH